VAVQTGRPCFVCRGETVAKRYGGFAMHECRRCGAGSADEQDERADDGATGHGKDHWWHFSPGPSRGAALRAERAWNRTGYTVARAGLPNVMSELLVMARAS
jgi:hypothetical protein